MQEVRAFTDDFLTRNPRADKLRLHYARYLVDQSATEPALNEFKTLIDRDASNADAKFYGSKVYFRHT